jgi:hypothetical protein
MLTSVVVQPVSAALRVASFSVKPLVILTEAMMVVVIMAVTAVIMAVTTAAVFE